MKKVLFLTIILIAGVAISCDQEPNLYNPEQKDGVADLIVPQDFDWKTTQVVSGEFLSNVSLPVYIYNTEDCNEDNLVAIYNVFPEEKNEIVMTLPDHQEYVYLKYADRPVVSVPIVDKKIAYTIPEGVESVNVKTRGDWGCGEDRYYFPCEGYFATIMFEDLFPKEGDYDFNDLVTNYKYECHLSGRTKRMTKLILTMRVNALGGVLEYYPGIRLDGIVTDKYDKMSVTGGYYTLESFPDRQGEMCFLIKGMSDKPAGCQFLNTLRSEKIIPKSELKTIVITILFKENNAPKLSELKSFDIFLISDDLEIHERGEEPAKCHYPTFSDQGDEYYCNKRNLVWSFTVPIEIPHAVERSNFLLAYPQFKGWAESAGATNKNWYRDGNEEFLIRIPNK